MPLNCPEKNTYTRPQAPAKIRPFPSCPRGDSGDKGKSKGREKKTRPFRLSLAPTISPWVCEDVSVWGKGEKIARREKGKSESL